jgi:hypothetical protein
MEKNSPAYQVVEITTPGTYSAVLTGHVNGVSYGTVSLPAGGEASVSFKLNGVEYNHLKKEFTEAGRTLRVNFHSDGKGVVTSRVWLNATPGSITALAWCESPGIHQIRLDSLASLPSDTMEQL